VGGVVDEEAFVWMLVWSRRCAVFVVDAQVKRLWFHIKVQNKSVVHYSFEQCICGQSLVIP